MAPSGNGWCGPGAPDAASAAPGNDVERGDVSGGHGVQLLYGACEFDDGGRVGADPGDGGGITDHCWTVDEMLWHKVPPPRWHPLKQRGRRSAERQRLIARGAPDPD